MQIKKIKDYARSKFMYAVGKRKPDGKYLLLSRHGKGNFTEDPKEARWYAYSRYAHDARDKLGEGYKVLEVKRNLDLCPHMGQKGST